VRAFADPDAGDQLTKIKITSLPSLPGGATININGAPVTLSLNQEISRADALTLVYQAGGIPAGQGTSIGDSFGWDAADQAGAYSSNGPKTVSIAITNVAPTLDTTRAYELPSVDESSANPAGVLVETLLGLGGNSPAVSDPGGPFVGLYGIAVVGADGQGHGTWQYKVAGGAWTDVGSPGSGGPVSDSNALLLAVYASTCVRFVPSALFNGTIPGLSFYAWDQSQYANGARTGGPGTSFGGGSSPFSTQEVSASVSVSPFIEVGVPIAFNVIGTNCPGTSPASGAVTMVTNPTSIGATGATFSTGTFRWTPPPSVLSGYGNSRAFTFTFQRPTVPRRPSTSSRSRSSTPSGRRRRARGRSSRAGASRRAST
jgi:hypothetical protein